MSVPSAAAPLFVSHPGLGNGQATPPESPVILQAGPLQVELVEGELRYFQAGGSEAVRRIYTAVRDGSWNTIPAKRSLPKIDLHPEGGFSVEWENVYQEGDVDFIQQNRLTGSPAGSIQWELTGVARKAFLKNRIGFCILHPLAICQGKPCEVESVGGDLAERTFPDSIAPDQPVRGFHDFRRMRYSISGDHSVDLQMEGDAFEMEDQRNWTDASFKTYSTPQRIPMPAQVREGQVIRQSITVSIVPRSASGPEGSYPALAPATSFERRPDTVFLPEPIGPLVPLPSIGLGMASHGQPLSSLEQERLRQLQLDHLRVDLKLSTPDWQALLAAAAHEAAALNCRLEIAAHATRAAQWTPLATWIRSTGIPVARWLVIEEGKPVVSPDLLLAARNVLPLATPVPAPVGAGTDIDFFPLNNNRPPADQADFIFCSVRPQAHAFDDATVIENLEGQSQLVSTARQLFAPLPFIASPVTLKRRWHKGPPRPAHELPPMVDRRQCSLLGAGWLLGSLRSLADAGAASATWFETTGWRGVMEQESGAPLPSDFLSIPGAVFPMYHVLRAVAEFRQGGLRHVALSHPLLVQAMVLENGPRQCWIVANVTGVAQKVSLPVAGTVHLLHSTTPLSVLAAPESFLSGPGQPFPGGTLEMEPWSLCFLHCDS